MSSKKPLEKPSELKDDSDFESISFDDIEELPEEDFDLVDDENPPAAKPVQPKPKSSKGKEKERPFGQFRNQYLGYMDLYGDAETVKNYLNTHQVWFRRCAHPLKAEPLGNSGYVLEIFAIGAFGFTVQPKIGLNLLPEDQLTENLSAFRIETIPIPDLPSQGYEVDFQAVLELMPKSSVTVSLPKGAKDLTSVEWQLDLVVTLQFPKFIEIMSRQLIEKTGDAILAAAVRQISRNLTAKVQADFHSTIGFPKKK
jgi:hypothetical protein